MVEITVFYFSTSVVWNLGWSLYIGHGQHIWRDHLLTIRLGCGTSRHWSLNFDGFLYRYFAHSIKIVHFIQIKFCKCLFCLLTVGIILVSVLSAIGICERCKVESGGVYFLLSYVLGSRIAAAVGLLYCFGQV